MRKHAYRLPIYLQIFMNKLVDSLFNSAPYYEHKVINS